MLFAVLSATFTLLLDLLHAVARREHDKTLEIVVFRQQLRLYARTVSPKPRLSRRGKVVLAPHIAPWCSPRRCSAGIARSCSASEPNYCHDPIILANIRAILPRGFSS